MPKQNETRKMIQSNNVKMKNSKLNKFINLNKCK